MKELMYVVILGSFGLIAYLMTLFVVSVLLFAMAWNSMASTAQTPPNPTLDRTLSVTNTAVTSISILIGAPAAWNYLRRRIKP